MIQQHITKAQPQGQLVMVSEKLLAAFKQDNQTSEHCKQDDVTTNDGSTMTLEKWHLNWEEMTLEMMFEMWAEGRDNNDEGADNWTGGGAVSGGEATCPQKSCILWYLMLIALKPRFS